MTMSTPASLAWRKSSRSSGGANNCVEVGFGAAAIAVRDTKDRQAGTLAVSPDGWGDFLAGIKRGTFDLR